MFFRRCRRFAMFIDPFTLNEKLTEAKSAVSLLEILQRQSKVFSLKDHGLSFMQSLKKLNLSDLENTFSDFRFKNFLRTLEAESSIDCFLSITKELIDLNIATKTEIDPIVCQKFNSILPDFANFSLKLQSKIIQILPFIIKESPRLNELALLMTESIQNTIKNSNPTHEETFRLVTSYKEIRLLSPEVDNKELFYLLEPFILSYVNSYSPSQLVKILESYSISSLGSNEFTQHLVVQILISSSKLSHQDLSLVLTHCLKSSDKILKFQETASLFIRDLIKHLQKLSASDLKSTLDALFYIREGNVHYYELLGISFVRNAKDLNDRDLINVCFILALAGFKSIGSIKTLDSILKPMMLAQASSIQGYLSVDKISPIGLISHADYEDLQLDQVKHSLFPDLKKIAKKARPVSTQEIFKATSHPFYDFNLFVKLVWSFLIVAVNSNIQLIDGTSLNLMIKLLNRQLVEINKGDIRISATQHDMLVQIQWIVGKFFKTIKNLDIPRSLNDYTLHEITENSGFLNEQEKEEDKEFVEKFEKFCQERFIKVNVPGGAGKFDKRFLVNGAVVHVAGKVNLVLARHCDGFREGEVNELIKKKVDMIGNSRLVKVSEWSKHKNDEYFKKIIEGV